ncbi:MAG: hypothetical protein SOY97_02485 [Candidatus Metalachnospira sp.]|nr:hypothetical protein [Candidatus Metalachnospira sp.]
MNTAKQDESYLIRYRTNIMSRLKSIDLFLKTKSSPYCKKDVAELLGITYEELDKITDELKIKNITRSSFMLIMKNGSGEFCRAFKRELECGLTDSYSPEQISYIYDIDIDIVINAFAKMGVSRLHRGLLETLFSNIYV